MRNCVEEKGFWRLDEGEDGMNKDIFIQCYRGAASLFFKQRVFGPVPTTVGPATTKRMRRGAAISPRFVGNNVKEKRRSVFERSRGREAKRRGQDDSEPWQFRSELMS